MIIKYIIYTFNYKIRWRSMFFLYLATFQPKLISLEINVNWCFTRFESETKDFLGLSLLQWDFLDFKDIVIVVVGVMLG